MSPRKRSRPAEQSPGGWRSAPGGGSPIGGVGHGSLVVNGVPVRLNEIIGVGQVVQDRVEVAAGFFGVSAQVSHGTLQPSNQRPQIVRLISVRRNLQNRLNFQDFGGISPTKIVSQASTKVKEAGNPPKSAAIFTEEATCVWPVRKNGWIAFPFQP